MVNKQVAACGTYAGYQRHRRDGTDPCRPCKDAAAEYLSEWRDANRPAYRRGLRRNRQHRQAMQILKERYPEEFAEIFLEIQKADGDA